MNSQIHLLVKNTTVLFFIRHTRNAKMLILSSPDIYLHDRGTKTQPFKSVFVSRSENHIMRPYFEFGSSSGIYLMLPHKVQYHQPLAFYCPFAHLKITVPNLRNVFKIRMLHEL